MISVSKIIIEEFQAVTGFSVNRIAGVTGVPRSTLANIVGNPRCNFSAAIAIKLIVYIRDDFPEGFSAFVSKILERSSGAFDAQANDIRTAPKTLKSG